MLGPCSIILIGLAVVILCVGVPVGVSFARGSKEDQRRQSLEEVSNVFNATGSAVFHSARQLASYSVSNEGSGVELMVERVWVSWVVVIGASVLFAIGIS